MFLAYTPLPALDGSASGAVAMARYEGQLLPPGRWAVRYPDGRVALLAVEDMPPHWREHLHSRGEFGKRLGEG